MAKPIPKTSWKPSWGWGYTLYTWSGQKLHRSGGLETRDAALAACRREMTSGKYEKVWLYELSKPQKVVEIKRPPKDDPCRGSYT